MTSMSLTLKLSGVVAELADEEKECLLEFAERLLIGQRGYAPLDLVNDPRDFDKESHEEVVDLLAYQIFKRLQRRKRAERTPTPLRPVP